MVAPVPRASGASARARPLTLFGRIAEYYRATLGADAGFVGGLSSNPIDVDHFDTAWPRAGSYELGELARAVSRRWRLPAPATMDAGRNVALFRTLCGRGLQDTDDELRAVACEIGRADVRPMDRALTRKISCSITVFADQDSWAES